MHLTEDNIGDYAETLVLQAKGSGRILDYSAQSVALLEGLFRISDELLQGENFPDAQRNLVVFYSGCYLGEVIARTLGGVWRFDGDDWANSSLIFAYGGGGLQVFPFHKLLRRVMDGPDSNDLMTYYDGLAAKLSGLPDAETEVPKQT